MTIPSRWYLILIVCSFISPALVQGKKTILLHEGTIQLVLILGLWRRLLIYVVHPDTAERKLLG